jgi:hypothetical protein
VASFIQLMHTPPAARAGIDDQYSISNFQRRLVAFLFLQDRI